MSKLATQSVRLSENDTSLIIQSLHSIQVAGKDAHIVSDCLRKVEKLQKKFLEKKEIPDEITISDNGQVVTKV